MGDTVVKNLYTKMPPITDIKNGELIIDAINNAMSTADEINIAVGYVSVDSLDRLDKLLRKYSIKNINLVIGMYATGIPESIYNRVIEIQKGWSKNNIGSIYLVNNMAYHGKTYVFKREGFPIQAIVGSANLSVLSPASTTLRQYEVAELIDDILICEELDKHIEEVIRTSTSAVPDLSKFGIVREKIKGLSNIENIVDITESEQNQYIERKEKLQFRIPIKAPQYKDRFKGKYAKSNINVCYGKGRLNKTNGKITRRNWYEAQITVSNEITKMNGYPKKDPFYIVTDDGYKFLAHSSADNGKQLTAYMKSGNDRIFGKWIKGRLVTAGYVKPFDDVNNDKLGEGIITAEMLEKAHMSTMILTKTNTQEYGEVFSKYGKNSNHKEGSLDKSRTHSELLDVWLVHFENVEDEK